MHIAKLIWSQSEMQRVLCRAALTGKHNTLVRRPPGWQGPPTASRQKISCYKMYILHNKRFDMTS